MACAWMAWRAAPAALAFGSSGRQDRPWEKVDHRLTCIFSFSPSSRTSSQKPGDDLLANFRQQFPEVAVGSSAAASTSHTATAGNAGIVPPGQERYATLHYTGLFFCFCSLQLSPLPFIVLRLPLRGCQLPAVWFQPGQAIVPWRSAARPWPGGKITPNLLLRPLPWACPGA